MKDYKDFNIDLHDSVCDSTRRQKLFFKWKSAKEENSNVQD